MHHQAAILARQSRGEGRRRDHRGRAGENCARRGGCVKRGEQGPLDLEPFDCALLNVSGIRCCSLEGLRGSDPLEHVAGGFAEQACGGEVVQAGLDRGETRASASASGSKIATRWPARAKTIDQPRPIRPAPITPICTASLRHGVESGPSRTKLTSWFAARVQAHALRRCLGQRRSLEEHRRIDIDRLLSQPAVLA